MADERVDLLVRARDRASDVLDKINKRGAALKSSFAAFNRVLGPLGFGLGAAGFIIGIKDMIDAASDAEESINKVREVFKQSAPDIEAWARTSATAIGASRNEAFKMTGEIGNLLVSFGLTTEEAAKFSRQAVQMAADIGSFNNAPTEEVLMSIRSALVGSSEPMLRFGADVRMTRLEQVALSEGISDTGKKLTSQQRALAALAAIQRDTATAAGDFTRTSDGLANSTKILNAHFQDLKTTLGEQLLPVASTVVQVMRGFFEETTPFERNLARLRELGASDAFIQQMEAAQKLNTELTEQEKLLERVQKLRTQQISLTRGEADILPGPLVLKLRERELVNINERYTEQLRVLSQIASVTKQVDGLEGLRRRMLDEETELRTQLAQQANGLLDLSEEEQTVLTARASGLQKLIELAGQLIATYETLNTTQDEGKEDERTKKIREQREAILGKIEQQILAQQALLGLLQTEEFHARNIEIARNNALISLQQQALQLQANRELMGDQSLLALEAANHIEAIRQAAEKETLLRREISDQLIKGLSLTGEWGMAQAQVNNITNDIAAKTKTHEEAVKAITKSTRLQVIDTAKINENMDKTVDSAQKWATSTQRAAASALAYLGYVNQAVGLLQSLESGGGGAGGILGGFLGAAIGVLAAPATGGLSAIAAGALGGFSTGSQLGRTIFGGGGGGGNTVGTRGRQWEPSGLVGTTASAPPPSGGGGTRRIVIEAPRDATMSVDQFRRFMRDEGYEVIVQDYGQRW